MFAPIGYPGSILGHMQINMYTLPAIVANVLVAVSFVLMAFFFNEAPMFREGKRGSVDSTETEISISIPPFDKVAVFLCIFAKMVQMFIYANMETIGSMYTQQMFNLTRTETTEFNSLLVSLSGFVGFAFLFTYVWTKLVKRVDNRIGAVIGVLICVGFLFTTYSYPFYTGNIESDGEHVAYILIFMLVSLTMVCIYTKDTLAALCHLLCGRLRCRICYAECPPGCYVLRGESRANQYEYFESSSFT
ncbi:hypothetical protein OESDEN_10480 [Oesophagostomum dentatum]|uniref:Uncharacterized protein n=1 Tax=Oesophagostomum dentatum TaxID=61180 RepID=A0A0B1T1P5_OESDE|nr:hypothetical protein OESDEN_10480 [Oesophagostomum dentatum]